MAIIRSNRGPENASEALVLALLATCLPGDWIVIPNLQLAHAAQVPQIDLVIIKDNAMITIEVKEWSGLIKGNALDDEVHVGTKLERNPIKEAKTQAESLATYLRHPDSSVAVFGDSRLALSLQTIPVVVFTDASADVQIQGQDSVQWLKLDEVESYITSSALGPPGFNITPQERSRLAKLLLGEPSTPSPAATLTTSVNEGEDDTQAGAVVEPKLVQSTAETGESPPVTATSENGPNETTLAEDSKHRTQNPQRSIGTFLRGLLGGVLGLADKVEGGAKTAEKVLQGNWGTKPITQADLARALERKLEQTLHHLMRETIAHNFFFVHLSPSDFAHYQPFKVRAEEGLVEYLQQVTNSRDYKLLGVLRVEIAESSEVLPAECLIESRIEKDSGHNKRIGAPLNPTASAWLEIINTGERIPLNKDVITIGRSSENEVCVGNQDGQKVVSRRHAHLRQENARFVLYDGYNGQSSKRGTYIDGRPLSTTQGHPLKDGERFCLGPTQRRDHNQPLQGSVMIVFHANS